MREQSPKDTHKILVVMLGGIGNLILLLPALQALRRHFPFAEIDLMTGEPNVEEIIGAHALINQVMLLDRRYNKNPIQALSFVHKIARKQYDLGILSSQTNQFKGKMFMRLAGISRPIMEEESGTVHETEGNNQLVKSLGIEEIDRLPQLKIFPEDADIAQSFLKRQGVESGDLLIGMHIGSGFKQAFKRWPKERFAQLADRCIERFGAKIVFTGSFQEESLVKQAAALMAGPSIITAGKLSIRESAGIVQQCSLFVSNDSGLAHIAAALNTPLVVLFGETQIERIAPRGERVHLVCAKDESQHKSSNRMESISGEDVFTKVEEVLKHG